MNIVAKSDLNFHGKALIPVSNITGTWLTSSDLAKALEYSNSRAVTMIYNKSADEFTSGMTQVLEVSTTGNYRKKVRVFSLRGAHLIAMFARTPVAKEFRRWVLDILDREVAHSPIAKQFSDEEVVNLCYMQLWMEKTQRVSKEVYPALKQLRSEFSGTFYDMAHETRFFTQGTRDALLREAANLDKTDRAVVNAEGMFRKLRGTKEIH
ncbi:BRO family protein [Erwinia sp. AnSW2-5]|uniref:BRO family protein n=1 Tax=Erwinia sp. AnSW2-5 TaxID=3367692 RepID=UPI00385DCFF9